jgi:two-component system, NarL family, nitrate/nitrite response regulator NarL
MRCTSVVIADPHPVVLQGLIKSLEAHRDFSIVARCGEGRSCIEALRNLAPDLAILAASMPGLTAREVLSIVKSRCLPTRLIFFTASDEDRELVMSAASNGYSIISKDVMPEALVQSLRQVAEGQTLLPPPRYDQLAAREQGAITSNALTTLTDRERQIMRLVSEGLSNKEIGRRLNITDGTIKQHLHHIFQKLEINNRTVLAALAISNNDRSTDLEESST